MIQLCSKYEKIKKKLIKSSNPTDFNPINNLYFLINKYFLIVINIIISPKKSHEKK